MRFAIMALLMLANLVLCQASDAQNMTSANFNSAGVTIHYVVAGSGSPVILVHGLGSSAEINWQIPGTFKRLAAHHQVIALDVRGHGRSGKPTEESAYGRQMGEDVIRLMDHLHLQKAHLVGYSMGGMIAMRLMVDHPDRILSCALCGMGLLKEGSPLQQFWGNMRGQQQNPSTSACMRSFSKLAVTEEAVRGIHLPVKILVGDHDIVKSLYVEPLKRVRKDWPEVDIVDAGHLDCIFKPQFLDELDKWLPPDPSPQHSADTQPHR
ncbi:MAG TPA: alpha/beta fold hydrolase [Chthonomonadaceae bacterium]|nr:alpha/beta fold hydrolase [Chthonomonadaceae bacterium]